MLSRPPVFILSCYRSGSTLLRYILDTHPEVYSPPELSLGQTAEFLGHFQAGLAGTRFDPERPGVLPPQVLAEVRDTLAAAAGKALERKGKSVFCEKSPSNVLYIPLLRALFPSARFLCLHRHAQDVIGSTIKMHAGIPELARYVYAAKGDLVTAFLTYWSEWTSILLELEKANPESCLRLRYEDLVSDPQSWSGRIFDFLGLEWDPVLMHAVFQRQHDAGREDPYIRFSSGIHKNSVGAGRGISLSHVRSEQRRQMEHLLGALGYLEEGAAGPARQPAAEVLAVRHLDWLLGAHLPAQILRHPEIVGEVNSTFQVVITDGERGEWLVDLREGQAGVVPGGQGGSCTLRTAAADLLGIAQGQVNPRKAFEDGRLAVEGNFDIQALSGLMRLLSHAV